MLGITAISLLAVIIAMAPSLGFTQEKKQENPAPPEKQLAPKGEKKANPIPFSGKLGSVDKIAKTITVGERVFQITSQTKLSKAGKPATLEDAVVGEEVGGSYQKSEEGKLNAKTVRFGPKPNGEAKKAAGAKKEK